MARGNVFPWFWERKNSGRGKPAQFLSGISQSVVPRTCSKEKSAG
jgi:hypothetical protein